MRDAMRMRAHQRRVRRELQAGATLVELMIGITLGLMILAALLVVFSNTSRSRTELERTSAALENGRYALELLTEDLQLAGFYGEFMPTTAPPTPLPDPCSTDLAVWQSALAIHAQGFNDTTGIPSCLPGTRVTGTDVLTLRRVRPCLAGTAGCDPVAAGEAYTQVAMCNSTPQPFVIGVAGAEPFSLKEKDCASAAALRQYVVHTYFISSDNGAGRAVPTLKRLELSAGAMREASLVEGIERIKFEYGIDTNGDGSADQFTADPDNFTYAGCTTCAPAVNWSNVMTIKVHVLARTLDLSAGYVDTKIYTLGRDQLGNPVTLGPLNDGYRRRVYTGVVRLMNPSTRKETP